jgi:hypothetical protein
LRLLLRSEWRMQRAPSPMAAPLPLRTNHDKTPIRWRRPNRGTPCRVSDLRRPARARRDEAPAVSDVILRISSQTTGGDDEPTRRRRRRNAWKAASSAPLRPSCADRRKQRQVGLCGLRTPQCPVHQARRLVALHRADQRGIVGDRGFQSRVPSAGGGRPSFSGASMKFSMARSGSRWLALRKAITWRPVISSIPVVRSAPMVCW